LSSVAIRGWGAVTPAGWGVGPFREALMRGEPLPTTELARPGGESFRVRPVPAPVTRPPFLAEARLRRTSPIAHFAVAAALEALGPDALPTAEGRQRLGIIYCAMAGCVNYSRRFYDETLRDPATASPLVFPETVFNSPASHLASLLGAPSLNYTLVGDPGTYLQGLALAADWLLTDIVDTCLVIGAEELDWLVAEALRLFSHQSVLSAGAGALYLVRSTGQPREIIRLEHVTAPQNFLARQPRATAARRVRQALPFASQDALLCDGLQGAPLLDAAEAEAWADWPGPRLSPKRICGEAFMASAAWECVAALDALSRQVSSTAIVSVVGCDQEAIAAKFGFAFEPAAKCTPQ
jgi:hypothetical protein